MGGGRGEFPPVGGSKGPEPLASPNVLHWVGWLPGTTRCGAGPAVPASHGAPERRTRAVQVEGPAVPETEIGAGGVPGRSGMPGAWKSQPARQSSQIQGAGHGRTPNPPLPDSKAPPVCLDPPRNGAIPCLKGHFDPLQTRPFIHWPPHPTPTPSILSPVHREIRAWDCPARNAPCPCGSGTKYNNCSELSNLLAFLHWPVTWQL